MRDQNTSKLNEESLLTQQLDFCVASPGLLLHVAGGAPEKIRPLRALEMGLHR